MQRILMASVLGLIACGSSAANHPSAKIVATTSTNDGDVVCGNEVSATTGMTHRVCHQVLPTSAESGEKDMVCTDETPTGTTFTKRVCRSKVEKEEDQNIARDIYLMSGGRTGCNPEQLRRQGGSSAPSVLTSRCDGQPAYAPDPSR